MGLLPARDNRYLLSRCINEKIRNITVKYNELPLLNPYNPDCFIFSVHSRVSSSFELFFNKIIYFLSKRQHFEAWKIVASLLPSQKALPLIAAAAAETPHHLDVLVSALPLFLTRPVLSVLSALHGSAG